MEFTKKRTLKSFRNQDIQNKIPGRSIKKNIAVVGLACRFPGSETLEEFWITLSQGKSCIKDILSGEGLSRFFKSFPKKGGFLKDIDLFDPDFFSIPSNL